MSGSPLEPVLGSESGLIEMSSFGTCRHQHRSEPKDTVRLEILVWASGVSGVVAVTGFLDVLTVPAGAM